MTLNSHSTYNCSNMHKSINPQGYGLEEVKARFLPDYEPFFAPLVGKAIRLLELGVAGGTSLRFWRDYFENATIVGLDCDPVRLDDPTGMIHVYQGYQQDTALLDRIAEEQAPDGFDVVIDDCSHIGRFARISFWHLFQNHLKPGGLYAIEDWGTGYWPQWPDGGSYKPKSHLYSRRQQLLLDRFSPNLSRASRGFQDFSRLSRVFARLLIGPRIASHEYGMVGFVKELLDACNHLGKIAIPRSGSGRYLDYGISQIYVNRWFVIVVKALQRPA